MTDQIPPSDAEQARATLRRAYSSSEQAQAWATLALASSIERAAATLARGLVEAAREFNRRTR